VPGEAVERRKAVRDDEASVSGVWSEEMRELSIDGYRWDGCSCGWNSVESRPVAEGEMRLIEGYLFRALYARRKGLIFKRWEVLWVAMEPRDVRYHPTPFPFKPIA